MVGTSTMDQTSPKPKNLTQNLLNFRENSDITVCPNPELNSAAENMVRNSDAQ